MAFAFHAEDVPEGSVWYSCGSPEASKPTIRVEMPNGRTPPLCVYFCEDEHKKEADTLEYTMMGQLTGRSCVGNGQH